MPTEGSRGWVPWALGLSVAFNLAFVGAFGYCEYRARCGRCATPPPASPSLKLTPEQQKSLSEGRARLAESLAPLRAQMAGHCKKLSEILATPEPDRAAIQVETAAMADLQRQVQNLILEHHLAERASLPADQRGCFSDLLKESLCSGAACGMKPATASCGGDHGESHSCGSADPKSESP